MPYKIKLLLAKSEALQERSARIKEQIRIQDKLRESLYKSSAQLLQVTRDTCALSLDSREPQPGLNQKADLEVK